MGLLNKFRKEGEKLKYREEVIQNLVSLFNLKESFGAWQRGLGLKHYSSNQSNQGGIQEIISDIVCNIENYEKRVHLIDVQPVKRESLFNLSLRIECKIGGIFHSFYIGFNAFQDYVEVEGELENKA